VTGEAPEAAQDRPAPTEEEQRWLDEAVNGLRRERPDMSSSVVLTTRQRYGLIVVLVVLIPLALAFRNDTAVVLLAGLNVAYAIVVAYRVFLVTRVLRPSPPESGMRAGMHHITDEEARAVPDEDLPIYTVLLPAYNEPGIMSRLVSGVGAMEYPRDKLDVQLLLEADDVTTVAAAEATGAAAFARVVLVPPAEPRTKPKACNYGLQQARGELTTIYDAEDRPDPLQLRRAVVAFGRVGEDVACLQARLSYHNADQNLLTKWFAIEYETWFGFLLPGLSSVGAPLPLGGTSNHLRTDVLRRLHGWDPFNVTEDADLGMRLARSGYHSEVLDSVTLEEANSDPINWARQRSRWNKGYLVTALVQLRHPVRLARELGAKALVSLILTVLATPVMSLLNPVAWLLSLGWWTGTMPFIASIFPGWLVYLSLLNLFVGNFANVYVDVVALRQLRRPGLLWACLAMPLYWVLMAVGTGKAFVQLITAPSYWEKTAHGLDAA